MNFNLNEEACGDRYHPTPITVLLTPIPIHPGLIPDVSTDTFLNTRIVNHNDNKHTNSAIKISSRFSKFPEDSQDFQEEKYYSRFPGFPGVLDTLISELPLLHCCKASPPFGWYSLCLPMKGWPSWVDPGSWLHTEINVWYWELNWDKVTNPSTKPGLTRSTLVIKTNLLPLRQTTTIIWVWDQWMGWGIKFNRFSPRDVCLVNIVRATSQRTGGLKYGNPKSITCHMLLRLQTRLLQMQLQSKIKAKFDTFWSLRKLGERWGKCLSRFFHDTPRTQPLYTFDRVAIGVWSTKKSGSETYKPSD